MISASAIFLFSAKIQNMADISNKLNLYLVFIGICLFSLLLILIFIALTPFAESGPRLEYKNTKSGAAAVFALREVKSFSGIVFDKMKVPGFIKSMGIPGGIGFLSEKNYQVFKTRYKTKKNCPASFLNRNVNQKLFAFDDPQFLKTFKSLKLKRGDRVTIYGASVSYIEGKHKGRNVDFSHPGSELFLLKKISVNGSTKQSQIALPAVH